MPAHLLQYSDLEGLYDDPVAAGRFAGLVSELRTPETVVVGTGDDVAPSVLSVVTGGDPALALFEHLRPDAEAFGNHDFDVGLDALRDVVRGSPATWLNSNLRLDGEPFAGDAGAVPATVVESGGVRVGLVGVTTPDAPGMNPRSAPLSVADPVATVEARADELRTGRGADAVVVLAHLDDVAGLAETADAEVDAMLAGHVHDPAVAVVDGTPVARPGAGGRRVVEVALGDDAGVGTDGVRDSAVGDADSDDADGDDADGDSEVADAGAHDAEADDAQLDDARVDNDGLAVRGEGYAVRLHDVAGAPVDGGVRAALRRLVERAGLDERVATVAEPVSLSREAGSRGESRVGNLVTDAYRWATGADVAVLAARAIREGDALAGAVTAFDLVEVVPFDDPLVTLEVSGATLRKTVREVNHRRRTMRDWYFGHVSGATCSWAADGSLAAVRVGGEPLRDDGTYALATTSYFVETDHIFSAFGEDHVVAYGEPQYRALVEYARERGIDPTVEGRIRRPDEAADGESG